ncbi:MAG: methyl-accepting chemotaxis protein, partial [Candidatus Margulisiibacteriota bacterium]
ALIKGVNGQLLMSGGIVDSKQGEFNIKQEVQGLQADMVSKVAALTAQGKQNITISALSQERGVKGITQLINLTILVNIVAGVTILLILAFIGRRMFTLVIGSLDKMVKAVLDIEQTGDFSKRVKVERDDEVGKIGTAFNSLIQMSQNAIKDITRVMSKVAEGDFSHQVEVDLKGDLGALKSNINASLKTLRFSMQELSDAMSALNEGNFDKRMSLQAFDVIVAPVNSALASLEAIVANINNIVSAMASNDLSKRVSVEARGQLDQLKSNINRTVQELSKTIKDIDLGASQVAAATHESSASVDQVKASSGEQLTYIESILSAITQTTGAVVEVGKNTEMASQSARETAEIIGKSSADMDRMSEVMKKIEENSQKISSITKVISGIASQTNLLSLNAAIEAARAGESGKGFAVVAEEVRKLAESSASSALEISELVSQAVTAVEQGVSVSSDVGTGMKKVIGSATTTDEMLARIAAAMEESAASMQEVNDDVGKLRNLGEGNASAAAELGNIMVNLSDIAEQTKVQLEAFKV